jgi:hypothetical protein
MWTISLSWRKRNVNKNELRSFLYPFDNEDGLDLDYGSATHGPPDFTVRPAATFVNDIYVYIV